MFVCVGDTVVVPLLGGELVLEADVEELAVELGEAPLLLLLLAEAELADAEVENVDTELAEEPEADEAEVLPESVAINAV
jgi:hypothetical protein